jgi:endogenous inhibitor of DNA gyrase (YacG/DUF329 family)
MRQAHSLKDNPDRPFCSERCRIIDLGNWASEDYSVSVPLADVDESVDREPPPKGSE